MNNIQSYLENRKKVEQLKENLMLSAEINGTKVGWIGLPSPINFGTDKLIIVCYPVGAGGKFLINSLGLSNSCVLQDQNLVKLQLSGGLTPDRKIDLLHSRIQEVSGGWNDLHLGDSRLFGFDPQDYLIDYPEALRFNNVIEELSVNNQHYFFTNIHNFIYLKTYLNIWKNAKVILFENFSNFILERQGYSDEWVSSLKEEWNTIKGSDWPNAPNSIDEMSQCSHTVIEELRLHFNYLYQKYTQYLITLKRLQLHDIKIAEFKNNFKGDLISWDNDWYYSAEDTVSQVSKLYENLNLPDFDQEAVTNFYHAWINKLDELKQNNIGSHFTESHK